MANQQTGTFPYSPETIPRTDGLVSGVNTDTGSVFLPTPGEMTIPDFPASAEGKEQDYVGNTTCVDTNTTSHTIFTGSF